MARRKVYACRDKGNADRSFRTTGSRRVGLAGQSDDPNKEARRQPTLHRDVILTEDLPAYQDSVAVPSANSQTAQLNITTGTFQTTSVWNGEALPTQTVYNKTTTAYSTNDVVRVERDQGVWFVSNPPSDTGTGYGALAAALATSDATASINLDASSPLDPGTSITATNWCDMEGSIGALCIVAKQGDEYILIQLACP